jgi:phage portal protein BeeE
VSARSHNVKLRTARPVTSGQAINRPRSIERAAGQRVQMVQLYGEPNAEASFSTFGEYARGAFGAQGFPGNAVAFTCIDRRMSVFGEATFKWRDLKDKHLFGSPALAKLETPWPGATAQDLFNRAEQDASIAGNAFIRDCGNRLERLRPDWVTIVSQVTEDALGEEVREVIGVVFDPQGEDSDRSAAFYPISEVAHWAPIPDPLANFRGMSWMTPVIRDLVGDVRMAEYREKYFTNAATPNLVIKYTQKMAPERMDRLRTAIQARHAGAENAFGTLVLDEGADLTIVGQDMVGSAFDALQAAGETRVCMAAGVPPVVAGARQGLEASAIGEYQVALRAFVDLKIRPNWRGFCGALQKLVQTPAGAQLWIDTTDVSALQQGEQDMAATAQVQAATIVQLVMQGFTADSAVAAVTSGDMVLLKHTGAASVQVQPGSSPAPGSPAPAPDNAPQEG